MRRLIATLIVLLLVLPALAGLASPFDEQIGKGESSSFELRDAELTDELGRDVVYEIRYTKWTPAEPAGMVSVYNHGLQSHRGWFNEAAGSLADDGYAVYAFDRIGSGESSDGASILKKELTEARGHIDRFSLYVETLARMVEMAGQENPGAKIAVWGNSYGAKVVTAFLFEHADTLAAKGVSAAVFTTPGLYSNSKTMPLAFSKIKLLSANTMDRFPVPMVEENGDNGAGWFIGPGPWFERIMKDERSMRDATKRFWFQTRDLDKFINGRPKSANFRVPTFHLMVEGDRLMDNRKMERHIAKHAPDGIFKYYSGGPGSHHLLFFTEDADLAVEDVKRFLEGEADRIDGRRPPAAG
jgi:alpha-beta hydrolase superfamily lysophospholipase